MPYNLERIFKLHLTLGKPLKDDKGNLLTYEFWRPSTYESKHSSIIVGKPQLGTIKQDNILLIKH